MRRTTKLACIVFATAFGGLVACTGGSGGLIDSWNGWDYDKGRASERELPVNGDAGPMLDPEKTSNEAPPYRGQDPEPQSVLGCTGKFECVVTGTTRTCITSNNTTTCTQGAKVSLRIEIALSREGGDCTIGDLVLNPNGTFSNSDPDDNDVQSGSWIPYGDGFKLVAGPDTFAICTRSAPFGPFDNGSGKSEISVSSGGSSSTSSSSSSSGASSGDVPIDQDAGF